MLVLTLAQGNTASDMTCDFGDPPLPPGVAPSQTVTLVPGAGCVGNTGFFDVFCDVFTPTLAAALTSTIASNVPSLINLPVEYYSSLVLRDRNAVALGAAISAAAFPTTFFRVREACPTDASLSIIPTPIPFGALTLPPITLAASRFCSPLDKYGAGIRGFMAAVMLIVIFLGLLGIRGR